MRLKTYAALGAALLLAGSIAAVAANAADPSPPTNAPDQIAWQFFIMANANAGGSNATFETWASDTDTFRPNAKFPTTATQPALHPPALLKARQALAQKQHKLIPAVPPGMGALEETRRNHVAFDFIVQNKLNSISGLKASIGKNVAFPIDAVEVKANWKLVSEIPAWTKNRVTLADVPKVFHVNTGSDGKAYALISMHVISKAVPNWTWATFENRLNPGRCDTLGCRDAFGAQTAVVKPNPTPGQGYPDCAKTPALSAMMAGKVDPVFANYCLKGSQVDFADNTGLAIRLGNSVTEQGFVPNSSCITCHSRAAWNAQGQDASPGGAGFPLNGPPPIGPTDPHWYWQTAKPPPLYQGLTGLTRVATSADFVWSIPFCAYDDSNPAHPGLSPCAGK